MPSPPARSGCKYLAGTGSTGPAAYLPQDQLPWERWGSAGSYLPEHPTALVPWQFRLGLGHGIPGSLPASLLFPQHICTCEAFSAGGQRKGKQVSSQPLQ